jgi:hypothetical protein
VLALIDMNSMARREISKGETFFVAVVVLLGAWDITDFIYSRHLYDLAGGVGFALMAYGTYRNGHRKPPTDDNDRSFDKLAHKANVVGLIFVIGSFAVRFSQ